MIRGEASAALEEPLALFDAEPELVSGEGTTTQVYRGQYRQRDVFLKISRKERWKVLLPRLLLARSWCSSVDLEARNLLRLQEAGIPVIPILGHGSQYVLGVPVSGVMLSGAVAGASLEDALMEERVAPPAVPMDVLFVQRKLGGLVLLATKLGARVDLRSLLDPYLGQSSYHSAAE